ncbi:MAG: methyltransferase domain-containing protein [Patescibacteria group bacterium]
MEKPTTKSDPSISRPLKTVERILSYNLVKEINKKIKISKEVSLLDLGSGVGRSLWDLSSIFSKKDVSLTLFGIYFCRKSSKKSIFYNEEKRHEDARKNPLIIAEEFNINTQGLSIPKLFNANACTRIPVKSNSIDLIYSTNAFHFFENKLGAITEISRILKINGRAIINIDRTDQGFWSSKISLPRLRIYEKNKILSLKNILKEKASNNFQIDIKKVNSYGTGLDSYILIITKKRNALLTFSELQFNKKQSLDLNKIRYSKQDIKNTLEYKKLVELNESFGKELNKEQFGGFLSIYKK